MTQEKPKFDDDDFANLEAGIDALLAAEPNKIPGGPVAPAGTEQSGEIDLPVFVNARHVPQPPASGPRQIARRPVELGSGERIISGRTRDAISDVQFKTPPVAAMDMESLIEQSKRPGNIDGLVDDRHVSEMPTRNPPMGENFAAEVISVLDGTHEALAFQPLPKIAEVVDSKDEGPVIETKELHVDGAVDIDDEQYIETLFNLSVSLKDLENFLDSILVFYDEMGLDLSTFSARSLMFEWKEKMLTIEESHYILFYMLKSITDLLTRYVAEESLPKAENEPLHLHQFIRNILPDIVQIERGRVVCDATTLGRLEILKRLFTKVQRDESLEPIGKSFVQSFAADSKFQKSR